MTSLRSRVVDSFSLGVPPKNAKRCVETIEFIIHDFEGRLKKEAGQHIVSSTLMAHGCRWEISCFENNRSPSSYSKIFFRLHSLEKYVDASFTLRHTFHNWKRNWKRMQKHFSIKDNTWESQPLEVDRNLSWTDRLGNSGSLRIAFDIELNGDSPSSHVWYPKKLEPQSILVDLYKDAASETADVVFSIAGTEYHAHKNILALRCKKLYEIANCYNENTSIPIERTKEMVFKCILEFVYTVRLPTLATKDYAKEVLIAADFYECIQLKLYVESVIVDKFLNPKNAAELFLFADSYSCALLKEKATKIFARDPSRLREAKEWSTMKESPALVLECLEALTSNHRHESDIATLRDSCKKQNLEVDGSRQVLTERLQKKRKLAAIEK